MDKYSSLLLSNQLCFPFYATTNKIIRKYQPYLKKLGLTYTQYIVMMVMWEKEVCDETYLCNSLKLRPNTLTSLLKRLEEKKYIDINKDEKDKRKIIISLSSEGKKLKDRAINVPKSMKDEFNLSEEEAIFLYKILYKILNYEREGK